MEKQNSVNPKRKRLGLSLNKFADWQVGNEYEIVKAMGQGSYADVVSAIHKPTGRKVAIKRMKGIFDDEVDCKRILREIYLLLNLRHPYIV